MSWFDIKTGITTANLGLAVHILTLQRQKPNKIYHTELE